MKIFLLMIALTVQARAQLKTELSPVVSFHCSNTILRVWHMSKGDYAPMSDDELENLRVELTETCQPKQGWTIEDGFYHGGAVGGVLSELLIRSRYSDAEHMRELSELLKENRALKDELKKNTKAH